MPGEHTGNGSNGSGSTGHARSPVARRTSNRPTTTPTAHDTNPAANPTESKTTPDSASSSSESPSAPWAAPETPTPSVIDHRSSSEIPYNSKHNSSISACT